MDEKNRYLFPSFGLFGRLCFKDRPLGLFGQLFFEFVDLAFFECVSFRKLFHQRFFERRYERFGFLFVRFFASKSIFPSRILKFRSFQFE
jgi:hypothetical protein